MDHLSGEMSEAIAPGQHEEAQAKYWNGLRTELQRYKDDFGATNIELSQGLRISRQPLVSFMQEQREDLPIQRINLMYLWDDLTSEESNKSKRLSQVKRDKRRMLGIEDRNRLLRESGFFVSDNKGLDINVGRYQHIQRLVSGLSHLHASDDGSFINIVTALERELISGAFGPYAFSNDLDSAQSNISFPHDMPISEIEAWINNWSSKHLAIPPTSIVQKKFNQAISRIIRQGKGRIENKEIFELYLSILENSRINDNSPYKHKVTHCQFSDISFSISSLEFCEDLNLRRELNQIFLAAEEILRYSSRCMSTVLSDDNRQQKYLESCLSEREGDDRKQYLQDCVSECVTETSVMCSLEEREFSKRGNIKEIKWSYSSSDTHYQNMFTAIYRGMGCTDSLELIDFSTISLGNETNSLVKSSTSFKGGKKLYQGVWVEESAILGTAKSVLASIKNWLVDDLNSPNSQDRKTTYHDYYSICRKVAEMDEKLDHASEKVGQYAFQYSNSDFGELNLPGLSEVVSEICSLKNDIKSLSVPSALGGWYQIHLNKQECRALLNIARSSFVGGQLDQAKSHLGKISQKLKNPKVSADKTIGLRLEYEEKLYRCYSGDRDFIGRRRWREDVDSSLKELRDHIYSCNTLKEPKQSGRGLFDKETYQCAASIFARLGRLECTFATAVEQDCLKEGVDYLLMAAYCVSKLGKRSRAAHYLANASRIYCRLGDGDRAKQLSSLAESILKKMEMHSYNDRYKRSAVAEIEISFGERELLIKKQPKASLKHFGKCLAGAAYLGFVRLLADSLYDISRAAKDVDELLDPDELYVSDWNDRERPQSNPIVIKVMGQIEKFVQNRCTWAESAPFFEEQAREIWDNWARAVSGNEKARHPIAVDIENGQYLCCVKDAF
ncbi:MAG: hypothetical protein AAGA67_03675, partial [Cyanobacteria bacterium P01_F01_bin.153]